MLVFCFTLLFCFVLNAVKVTGTVSSVGKMLGAKEAQGSGLIPNIYAQLWLIITALERQPAYQRKISEREANETDYIKKGGAQTCIVYSSWCAHTHTHKHITDTGEWANEQRGRIEVDCPTETWFWRSASVAARTLKQFSSDISCSAFLWYVDSRRLLDVWLFSWPPVAPLLFSAK